MEVNTHQPTAHIELYKRHCELLGEDPPDLEVKTSLAIWEMARLSPFVVSEKAIDALWQLQVKGVETVNQRYLGEAYWYIASIYETLVEKGVITSRPSGRPTLNAGEEHIILQRSGLNYLGQPTSYGELANNLVSRTSGKKSTLGQVQRVEKEILHKMRLAVSPLVFNGRIDDFQVFQADLHKKLAANVWIKINGVLASIADDGLGSNQRDQEIAAKLGLALHTTLDQHNLNHALRYYRRLYLKAHPHVLAEGARLSLEYLLEKGGVILADVIHRTEGLIEGISWVPPHLNPKALVSQIIAHRRNKEISAVGRKPILQATTNPPPKANLQLSKRKRSSTILLDDHHKGIRFTAQELDLVYGGLPPNVQRVADAIFDKTDLPRTYDDIATLLGLEKRSVITHVSTIRKALKAIGVDPHRLSKLKH